VTERSAEAARNRRLRLVDWRFLLPSPRPRRALCRTGGALADAVAEIADEVVTDARSGTCDLAVAVAPDAAALRELRGALVPGGVCYTEWPSGAGQPRRVETVLRAAGFETISCYRRWPRSARLPAYWVPVDAPGAEAFVRARARLPGGRARRLAAELVGRGRQALRGRLGGSLHVVATVGAGGTSPSPLLAEWPSWGLGPRPDRLSLLLATGGPRSVSKVVLLAFAEPEGRPLVAIKAPRVPEAADGVRREADVLQRIGRVAGVPRLLLRRECDGVPMIVETALPGRPLEGLINAGNLAPWATRVSDWLAGLGQGASSRPAAHWREAIVEPALTRFERAFGGVADPELLRAGAAIVRRIGDLPSVPEQRDFGPWNVLVGSDDGLAVLDWESGEAEGLPALDLLYFLAYASFGADRARSREHRVASFTRSLNASSPTGAVRRTSLERYARTIGLDQARLAPLRALVWLIHAYSDFRHAEADAAGPPAADALRRSLFLALWSAEVRDLMRS
jgi:Phosphotransferase enzyme family